MQKLNKYLLLINLFFLQSYLIRFNLGPYPSNLQEVLIALNGLTFLATLIKEKRWPNWRKHWILGIFLILSAVSFLSNTIISEIDFIRHLKFLFFAGTLTTIFLETFNQEKEKIAAFEVMGLGAIIFGIFSVTYNLLGFNVAHDLRLLGPLDAAVYLAYYFAPFFIFFTLRRNWLYALILGLLILSTKSMGAIGGSAVVIGFYYARKIDKRILISVATLLAVVIFYNKILPTIQTDYSSLDERGEIWQVSGHLLSDWQTLIFGAGLSQFEASYIEAADTVLGRPPLDYHVIQPHNIFLLFIFHYGILGLIFILYLIYEVLCRPKSVFSWMLIYFFIHGLIDTPYYKNDLLFILMLLMSLAVFPRGKRLA